MNWLSGAINSVTNLFRWWIVVAPWEQCLRVRGGQRAKLLHAGIHFRIPLLDRVILGCTRERRVENVNITLTTPDRRVIILSVAVRYAIGNLEDLLNSIAFPESTLMAITQAEIASYVTTTNSDEFALTELECNVTDRVSESTKHWGLSSLKVSVIGCAFDVRVLRLLMNDYVNRSGMDDELDDGKRRREA